MNRSELAALIAANPPVTTSSSPKTFQEHLLSPARSSPASPRQQFQFRVRDLQQQHSPSRRRPSTRRRRHSELEHVSTLRVTHQRSLSAQPPSEGTPDFSIEEREAWGSRSPDYCRQSPESHVQSPSRPKLKPVLPPPYKQTHGLPQPRKQMRARVPLRTFEPLQTIADVDERPKTSRGNPILEILQDDEQEDERDGDDPTRPSGSAVHNCRTSKFIEGSMNERSFGIASSWSQGGLKDDEKPLPLTPPTKHVTFSCTPIRESFDEETTEQDRPTPRRKERRGLRKSISNFNFQALSEKMKIFGGSSNDTGAETGEKKKMHKHDAGADLMNERKRKAEEAYAAQFGFKKQKVLNAATTAALPPNVDGHGQHARSISQDSHAFRSSRRSAAVSFKSPGLRKKKSRRELEQENGELRGRLAQQDEEPAGLKEKSGNAEVVPVSLGKRPGKLQEDVPSVPQLPGRGVLKALENSKGSSDAPVMERKGEFWNADQEKQVRDGKQQWEWPEDVF